MIESFNSNSKVATKQIIDSKITLLEYLTKNKIKPKSQNTVLEEFSGYDKDIRTLTYKILLEKFNDKYDLLTKDQKQVLKEYITAVDSTPDLRSFYNSKILDLKSTLTEITKNIKDKATQVKITEVTKFLTKLKKTDKVGDDNLVDLLRYYQLVNEIQIANGVQI